MIDYDIKQEENKITVNVKLKKRSGQMPLVNVTTQGVINYLNEQKINLTGFTLPDYVSRCLDNESGPWERTLIFTKKGLDTPKNILDKPKKRLDKPKRNVVSSSKAKKTPTK